MSVSVPVRNRLVCMYRLDGIYVCKRLSVHVSQPAPVPRTVSASRSMSSSRLDAPKQGFTMWEVDVISISGTDEAFQMLGLRYSCYKGGYAIFSCAEPVQNDETSLGCR